jgi:hypothetical protein
MIFVKMRPPRMNIAAAGDHSAPQAAQGSRSRQPMRIEPLAKQQRPARRMGVPKGALLNFLKMKRGVEEPACHQEDEPHAGIDGNFVVGGRQPESTGDKA